MCVDQHICTSRAFTLLKKFYNVTFESQFFTAGCVPSPTAPGAAAGFLSHPRRGPGSPAAGCQSRSYFPPGLARGRQNRLSGRDSQHLLAKSNSHFHVFKREMLGRATWPSEQSLALGGRSVRSVLAESRSLFPWRVAHEAPPAQAWSPRPSRVFRQLFLRVTDDCFIHIGQHQSQLVSPHSCTPLECYLCLVVPTLCLWLPENL